MRFSCVVAELEVDESELAVHKEVNGVDELEEDVM